MAVLRSEEDFTDPELSRERRWLALFLMVHMVDEHGRMGAAYRRVLRRAARVRGHWAQGRSLGAVRAEVTRWIGVHARSDMMPPWDRIADLVHDTVHPRSALDVLATARYLHCLATGEPNDALIHRPEWLDPDAENITAAMIGGPEWARKHGLPEAATTRVAKTVTSPVAEAATTSVPETVTMSVAEAVTTPVSETVTMSVPENATTSVPEAVTTSVAETEATPVSAPPRQLPPPRPQPPQPRPAGTPVERDRAEGRDFDQDHLELDPDQERSAYQMLWTVVRVHRDALARIAELEHRVQQLHEENARLSGDVTSWLGDYRPAIPDQDRRPRPPRPVADRHLAPEDPAPAFTYPLPADLPAPRPTN